MLVDEFDPSQHRAALQGGIFRIINLDEWGAFSNKDLAAIGGRLHENGGPSPDLRMFGVE